MIPNCNLNRQQATSNNVDFSNWISKALDVLSGTNAGLFLVILRKVLGREKDEASKALNDKINEIQRNARKEIRALISEYEPELSKNKWF